MGSYREKCNIAIAILEKLQFLKGNKNYFEFEVSNNIFVDFIRCFVIPSVVKGRVGVYRISPIQNQTNIGDVCGQMQHRLRELIETWGCLRLNAHVETYNGSTRSTTFV